VRDEEAIRALALLAEKTNGDEDLSDVVEGPGEVGERVGQGHVEAIDGDEAVRDDVHPAPERHEWRLVLRKDGEDHHQADDHHVHGDGDGEGSLVETGNQNARHDSEIDNGRAEERFLGM